MEMTRRLLKPETYRTLSLRDLPPVPASVNRKIMTTAMAYRDAANWADFRRKNGQPAQVFEASRDRFYSQLKPLLDQLVR